MKSLWWRLALALVTAGSISSALLRHRQESRQARTVIVADWSALEQACIRSPQRVEDQLRWLRRHGVGALLLSGRTLEDLWRTGEVQPVASVVGGNPLQTRQIQTHNASVALQLYWEWSHRGVSDLPPPRRVRGTWVFTRTAGTFEDLRTVESGYDLNVATAALAMRLPLMVRVAQDPWVTTQGVVSYLRDHPLLPLADALLFATDQPPGGKDADGFWMSWLSHRRLILPFTEGKPPRIQRLLARQHPGLTRRLHTIPLQELRDLPWPRELARWRRAAMERSCRFLIVQMSDTESPIDYAQKLDRLKRGLEQSGMRFGWPRPEPDWQATPLWIMALRSGLAFCVVLLAPWLMLKAALQAEPPGSRWMRLVLGTLLAGLAAAALSNMPELRLAVIPFRGVKAAMLGGWSLAALSLFPAGELAQLFKQGLRRWELLLGLLVSAVLGYVMLRSGNASSGWQAGFEQPLRNVLEILLPARPRFKEFAVGYPFLVIGLLAYRMPRRQWGGMEWRVWLAAGMLGPVSTLNTFCHMHSPIALALWRSVLGILIGSGLGWLSVKGSTWKGKCQQS